MNVVQWGRDLGDCLVGLVCLVSPRQRLWRNRGSSDPCEHYLPNTGDKGGQQGKPCGWRRHASGGRGAPCPAAFGTSGFRVRHRLQRSPPTDSAPRRALCDARCCTLSMLGRGHMTARASVRRLLHVHPHAETLQSMPFTGAHNCSRDTSRESSNKQMTVKAHLTRPIRS